MIHGFAVGNTNSGGGGGGITAVNISAGSTSSNVTAVTFSNANGVSFGYDGSNITATVQTNYLTTAMASNRGSDFVQATAGFHGTNASGTIASSGISVSVAAQSVQTQNNVDISLSGNTAGALALISSGTAILAGGNNITLSQNGQSVTISAFNQSVQTQNNVDLTLGGNTSGVLALISSGTAFLAGGNNITLSQNGQSVTISGANTVAQTVQTQNCVDISLSGNTTGTLTLISSGTAILAGGNNITLSQNGQSVTISAASQTVQTQHVHDLSLSGNTTGTLTLISSGTAILAGGNNITLSQNGQSVTISAFNQSVQTQNNVDVSLSGNTTGTLTLISSGTAILAGGNNITLSQNGQSITISAFNQSVQTQNNVDISLSGNTTGTLTLISSGTAILAGGNNITLSQNGQSVTISCGAAGTNSAITGGSLTVNTSGISINVPIATLSYYACIDILNSLTTSAPGGGQNLRIQPFILPQPVSIGFMRWLGSFSAASASQTGTSVNTSFTMNNSFTNAPVFMTQGTGANSLSLQYSTSTLGTWVYQTSVTAGAVGSQYTVRYNITYPTQGTTSAYTTSYATSTGQYEFNTTILSLFTGPRFVDIPFAGSLSAGNYWVAFGSSSAFASNTGPANLSSASIGMNSVVAFNNPNAFAFPGVATNASILLLPGYGSFTSGAKLISTSSIGLASIGADAGFNGMVYFQFLRYA